MADLDVAVRLKFLTEGEGKLKAAAKDLAAFGKGISGKTTGRFGADLNKAWHASAKLGGSLDKSAKAAGKTATAMRAIGQTQGLDRARTSVDRLTKSTNALASAERKVRATAVVGSGGGGALAAGALGGAAASRRKAAMREGLVEATSRVSPGAGYMIGAGGAVALGAGIGIAAAGAYEMARAATRVSIGEAISREAAFADIQKKVDLDVGQRWADIDRQVRSVSVALGSAYQDTAAIFAQGGQGGIATRDLKEFSLIAAKTAVAWDMGAKEAAQMFTEVRAGTGKSISQLEVFANKVNGLGDVSAAAEKDIAAMAQRAMAAMHATGVGEDQALAMMTALRGVGMQDEVAARFLPAFTSKLRTATTQSKDAQKAFKELGLSAKDIEKGMQTRPMETILQFLNRVSKAKNPVGIMKSILGGEWWDEGMRFAQAAPELIRLLDYLGSGKWRGSMDRAMEIDLGTTEAKLKQLKESILDIFATAAKPIVLPALSSAADYVKKAADDYRESRQRAEDERAAVKPVGRSSDDFARDHGLDRPIREARAPMIAQLEGATPQIAQTRTFNKFALDAWQFGASAKLATSEVIDLSSAMDKLNVTVKPTIDGGAAIAQARALKQEVQAAAEAMNALRNFGTPGSRTRVNPTITGAPRGGGSSGGGGSAPATPGKQSSLGRGGGVQIATAHFHGVKDARAMHRQLAALDRRIRSARDNALHDVG